MAGPEAREVLTEDDVQYPVQTVLHTPMGPDRTGEGQSTQCERAQIKACLVFDLSVSLDLGFNPADHREVREYRFAWVMPVRCHPVDLLTHRVPASFDPPSGQVHRLIRFKHHV